MTALLYHRLPEERNTRQGRLSQAAAGTSGYTGQSDLCDWRRSGTWLERRRA